MDNNKDYKDAFEKAKMAHGTGCYDDKTLEFIFPQLVLKKEPSDEDIINVILEAIRVNFEGYHTVGGIEKSKIIGWLERQKEHQNKSDAPNDSSWDRIISSSDKDSNLDELSQDYVDGVKKYNPEPTWDLMQTAVCYGYHLGANHQVLDDEHLFAAIQVQFGTHAKIENGKRYAKLTWDEFTNIVFELCSRGKQKEQKKPTLDDPNLYYGNWDKDLLKEIHSWLGNLDGKYTPYTIDDIKLTARHFVEWQKQKEQKPSEPVDLEKEELKESEDERIRKFLIGLLSSGAWRKEWPFSPIDCVTWLEKQKEQKPINVIDPFSNANFVRGYESGYADAKREQKPAEWSDEDEDMRDLLIKVLEANHPDGQFKANEINTIDMRVVSTQKLVSWLKSLPDHNLLGAK